MKSGIKALTGVGQGVTGVFVYFSQRLNKERAKSELMQAKAKAKERLRCTKENLASSREAEKRILLTETQLATAKRAQEQSSLQAQELEKVLAKNKTQIRNYRSLLEAAKRGTKESKLLAEKLKAEHKSLQDELEASHSLGIGSTGDLYLVNLSPKWVNAFSQWGGWGFGNGWHGGQNSKKLGRLIKVGGKICRMSMMLHPRPGAVRIIYRLPHGFKTIQGGVGLADSAGRSGNALTFQIRGDGKVLWTSTKIQRSGAATPFSVSISGIRLLELVVTCHGSNHNRHAVWVDPKLIRKEESPVDGPETVDFPADLTILNDRLEWNKASKIKQDKAIKIVGKRLGKAYKFVRTKVYKCGGQSHRIATFKHVKTAIELNLIPGGKYIMGTDYNLPHESPAHPVHVSVPLLVGRFELKQKEWEASGMANPSKYTDTENPIESVSRPKIRNWLTKTGDKLRLLSGAEWVYCCRAGTTTNFFWGNKMDWSYAWGKSNSTEPQKTTKHMNRTNAFGLSDMIGNVMEWVADDWSGKHDPNRGDRFPRRIGTVHGRGVIRGGHFSNTDSDLQSSCRGSCPPTRVGPHYGIRVGRTIE